MHSKLHVALSRFSMQQLLSLMSKADAALSRSSVQQLYGEENSYENKQKSKALNKLLRAAITGTMVLSVKHH